MGLISGFVIAIFGLSGATYLGIKDKAIASASMSGVTLVGLVTAFVSGRSINEKQSQNEGNSRENEDDLQEN